jgi:hypothetical protein
MMRRILHFAALFASAIITGAQYTVTFDFKDVDMPASFYTEKMQYAIHHIGTPLFSMLIAATVLNLCAAFLYRNDRRTCLLLSVAGVCFLAGGLITAFGNVPLLNIIDTWNSSSPPANWNEIARQWFMFHTLRFGVDLLGLMLATISAFTARRGDSMIRW